MDDRRFMTHVYDAETALSCIQQDLIQVVSDERKQLVESQSLCGVDE
jgi:hypothetical protein